MSPTSLPPFVSLLPKNDTPQKACGSYVSLLGEPFYRITNYDALEPFFMSIVSSSDHWLFIATTGGLSAGRVSAENAVFPYYTVDKITENHENTGHKAILRVRHATSTTLWEPFTESARDHYHIERAIYKNIAGTAVVFEEHNLDLGLRYRYAWRTGEKYGLIKTAWLTNTGDATYQIDLLDGVQNLLPANISSWTQNNFSNLLDAYKRSELEPETGVGIFALSSTLTDLAEPSESLLATTVAHVGLTPSHYLLSAQQISAFRRGAALTTETDVRGQRSAYFIHAALDLAPNTEHTWHLLIDSPKDHVAVTQLIQGMKADRGSVLASVEVDLSENNRQLQRIIAGGDGLQSSNDPLGTAHHFANVMFNVMRGGIFPQNYTLTSADFAEFVHLRNHAVRETHTAFFAALPPTVQFPELLARAEATQANDLLRLCYAYLPLIFSRRHGDPSRPWNRFAINLKKADGSQRIDYEGNWRDIFQNWEALAYSYPEFTENMLSTFLNATTADGYNPYRITQRGIDWEKPEPDNPWANIGYWSDHQIIYLQKLMEVSAHFHPGKLQNFLARPLFSYAEVPYNIKPYADLLANPYNTIEFDWDLEKSIEHRVHEHGTDGRLVIGADGRVLQVSLAEKLLTLLLAKLSNFVPEGGIWMNTQRPEWNDANNALVGKGLSVVTLGYLRRYVVFCKELFSANANATVPLNREVHQHFAEVAEILKRFEANLQGTYDNTQRRAVMDALGEAGSRYRWQFYQHGFAGDYQQTAAAEIVAFLESAQKHIEHSLRANRRTDGLYHAYNLLHLSAGQAAVNYLYEMLEGQVSILSSGFLSDTEALALLNQLRHSALYRADQHSYILYPDRDLPGFLVKNKLSAEHVRGVKLFDALLAANDKSLITQDAAGDYHFNGTLRNADAVKRALKALAPQYAELAAADTEQVLALYEATFRHAEFTGRSGTFFAYEGLGSIYWHMVSKLLLAVQETALRAAEPTATKLREFYMDVRAGLGFNKSPEEYGAFPTDPYSHTPKGQGAKQPGMTGMVKEEILTRWAELGVRIENGVIGFDAQLLNPAELLTAPVPFEYVDVHNQTQRIELNAGELAFTLCQTLVVAQKATSLRVTVQWADGTIQTFEAKALDAATSQHIFQRDGRVRQLTVSFPR